MARYRIALKEELRNVEAVVHVLRDEGDLNHLPDRDDELSVLGRRAEDFNAVVWIGELPLPLIADNLNFDFGFGRIARINNVEHVP